MHEGDDTIVAVATPPGRGGIGIIRVSGKSVQYIISAILGKTIPSRRANYLNFLDADQTILDQGIALFFPAPNSFTGEDVLELQGHGGPVVLDSLIQRILTLGARLAKPGEFSERAFLNGRLDLIQAEAVADLIDSTTKQAAKAALNSLQGEFSVKINQLVELLIHLRMYVESAMDFPDEEIDFLSDGNITAELDKILFEVETVRNTAKQGQLLREGISVVIIGKPNAGKSSLLNRLAGYESAIVTEMPGTTRDVLREKIQIDGIPLHVIDTAGLRESTDTIEQEGIRRAWLEVEKANQVLLVIDGQELTISSLGNEIKKVQESISDKSITVVINKIDLYEHETQNISSEEYSIIKISAKTGEGIDLLRQHFKKCMGFTNEEGVFLARRRHLDALERAYTHLKTGMNQLLEFKAAELLAEELLQAQNALSEITGVFSSDDLLGKIFASFCIGK